jgi:3-mercaptopyruvate sulfurtransferase SseA
MMDWNSKAKRLVKSELAKREIDYIKLAELMKAIGVDEKQVNIANKINRGAFSLGFALQIFKAIGVNNVDLKDIL